MSLAAPFYFAWVDPGTTFDSSIHNRKDELIVRWSIEHNEGEFATLSIDIKNPRVGLLSAGRKLWAFLSWDDGTDIVPLFFGRLVALPSNIHREIVTLQFIARPSDYGAQKELVAAQLRVLPYWDPVFITPENRSDPDTVLEGRTEAWAIDRVSLLVTTSDLVVGEDGTLEFQESEVPYDSVDISIDQPPIRTVHVEAEVPWTQGVEGNVDGFQLSVLTIAGSGLLNGWPEADADLGGGWSARNPSAKSPFTDLKDEDFRAAYPGVVSLNPFVISSLSQSASANNVSVSSTVFGIVQDKVNVKLDFHYKADRQYKEIIVFDLIAEAQPLVVDPEDDDLITLKLSGVDVSLPLDPLAEYSEIPIGFGSRRSYFATDRGKDSLQYLIQLARANIIERARAIKTTFKCKLVRALDFSLRKNVLLHDRRIPGGTALGKIVGYTMMADGGEISATCKFASVVGYGGAVAAVEGDPEYCDQDYVEDEYQFFDGAILVLAADDVGFTDFPEEVDDDHLVFPLVFPPYASDTDHPHAVTVSTKGLQPVPATIQPSVSLDDCGNTTSISYSMSLDTGPYSEWLGGITTTVDFALKAVEGGPFETTLRINVTPLKLPQQIDLSAT
jgi:hypothetical protein